MITVTRTHGSPYRRLRAGDRDYGTACACGNRKSVQALSCMACRCRRHGYGELTVAERNRRWRYRHLGLAATHGRDDNGEQLRAELELAYQDAAGELARLVDEQRRDQQHGHRAGARWHVSLDATDRHGRPLYDHRNQGGSMSTARVFTPTERIGRDWLAEQAIRRDCRQCVADGDYWRPDADCPVHGMHADAWWAELNRTLDSSYPGSYHYRPGRRNPDDSPLGLAGWATVAAIAILYTVIVLAIVAASAGWWRP